MTCTDKSKLTVLHKQSEETRLFGMDFSNKMERGESISSVTSTESAPSGVTFAGTTIDNNKHMVNVLCVGGTSGKKYQITIKVATSYGQVLENEGFIRVQDI